jgi:hypothetical protein
MTDSVSPNLLDLFDELLDTITFLTRRDFDEFDEEMAKIRVVELLCKFEVSVPAIEHAIVFHELLHLVVDIGRWGSGTTPLFARKYISLRWRDPLLSDSLPCPYHLIC